MMVLTAAPHRGDAFAAAEFLMDYLKSRAPFWKKEVTAGGAAWVAARDEDEAHSVAGRRTRRGVELRASSPAQGRAAVRRRSVRPRRGESSLRHGR